MTDEWDPREHVVQSPPPHLMRIETRAQESKQFPKALTELNQIALAKVLYFTSICFVKSFCILKQ